MRRVKAIAAYSWVGLLLLVALLTFLANAPLARKLVSVTGMTISPRFSGGEVMRTVDHGTYQVRIHRPVFDGLFSDRWEGFVQITWAPLADLPSVIEESVDIEGSGKEDFAIRVDRTTAMASLLRKNDRVIGVPASVATDNGWLVRVQLKKKK